MRRLNQKSNLSRIFDCSGRRYWGESRIYVNMQSNLIDSNVALHMHLTLALSSAHVKFDFWTRPKSKHFDITISLICAPQITELKINVYANEIHQAFETLTRFALILKNLEEGDMGVYGIAVLGFFSYGISVILILTCGITVSSSSAVCGFSSFWLTVFGEIRLFTVLRYRLFALSFRYNTQNKTQ